MTLSVCVCVHLLADSVVLNNSGVCVMWLLLALPIDWLLGEAEGGVCMLISFRRWSWKTHADAHRDRNMPSGRE